ncbi:MAG: isocitrate/isopropylmalate dehydrogenase family protein [Terriglobia bacterium]
MDILVLPGDGIGPEITAATLAVLEEVNKRFPLDLKFRSEEIGFASLERRGSTLPASVLEAVKHADGVILGPVSHLDYPPRARGGINVSGELRKVFDLYANIRPARSRQGLSFAGKEMDLVIVRENTEGFYSDRNMVEGSGEFMPTKDVALSLRKVTAFASNRIARTAFELAATRRKKVTAVHKANVLKLTEGVFLHEVREVAKEFPGVALEEIIVDAMAAHLIRNPARFDVIVTTNMFGDILSDEAAELSGSLGLAASLNAGSNCGVAQAQHGSAPGIAGQDKANPTSLIVSSAMLLGWLGQRHKNPAFIDAAASMEAAVDAALANPATRTADVGGKLGTKAFAAAVVSHLRP